MGYRKEDLNPELERHLSEAFSKWLKNVVSIPIDLPGFGTPVVLVKLLCSNLMFLRILWHCVS
jgi:hypothetical protein